MELGGLWSRGDTLWMAHDTTDKIYSFNTSFVANATLASITVDGTAVPGLSDSRTSYEYGVDASQVSIIATPTNTNATVAYSGTDQDPGEGLQMNLSNGRNQVTITVTAQDGTTTETYTLSVNRSVFVAYGWYASKDIDNTPNAAGNIDHRGVWTDGTTMWVADIEDDKLYAYTLSTGLRDTSKEWDLHATNVAPRGIWSDGTTMWVADTVTTSLFAYTLSTRARDTSKEWDLHSDNNNPAGIWSDGTTMWVSDQFDEKVYAYALSDGDRDTSKEWDLHSDNGQPFGIWSDETTMWVADGADDKLYAYALSNGDRDSDKDFNTLSAAGNNSPWGLTSDGKTMWVSDDGDDKVYAYFLGQPATDATLSSLTVDGAAVPGLDADRTEAYEFGVAHDVAQVTVAAVPTDSGASAAYSVSDADGVTEGHQIDLSRGRNEVTVTVTAQDPTVTKTYVLRVNRGYSDLYEWKAVDDVDSLITAGNTDPAGVWSDGTTLWVADSADDKLYAYTLSTKARNSDSDIDLDSANGDAAGVWSDGTTLWVADSADDKLYAYTLSTKARNSDSDIDLDSANGDAAGVWSDGTTLWVADSADDKAYAYTLSTKARNSGSDIDLSLGTITSPHGLWSDDTTLWVSGTVSASAAAVEAYTLSSKARDSSKDFDASHLASVPVTGETFLWGRGSTMWMSAPASDKVYSFNVAPPSTDATLSSLTVDGAAVPGLDADRTEAYEFGVAHDVAQVTVAAVPSDSEASAAYSVEDADDVAEGLQIDLSRGRNEVTVTVTAENPTVTETYVLRVNRGYSDFRTWKAVDDVDTLITAGNTNPRASGPTRRRCGWPTPTTTSSTPTRCRAGPATATRTSTSTPATATPRRHLVRRHDDVGGELLRQQALRLHAVGRGPRQQQGHRPRLGQRLRLRHLVRRTTMWVLDYDDFKAYAYTLSNGDRDEDKDIDFTSANLNAVSGIWSDGETIWVSGVRRKPPCAAPMCAPTTCPTGPATPARTSKTHTSRASRLTGSPTCGAAAPPCGCRLPSLRQGLLLPRRPGVVLDRCHSQQFDGGRCGGSGVGCRSHRGLRVRRGPQRVSGDNRGGGQPQRRLAWPTRWRTPTWRPRAIRSTCRGAATR